MMKYVPVYALLMLVFCTPCKGQDKTDLLKVDINSETEAVITSHGPITITRGIEQDRSGNIWFATFQGVFRYDGKSFTKITSEVSSARFFSVLEDSKGNLWFGSIGSGVYFYDGKSFQNFTTREGLLNNEVVSIYEDKKGNIWFGVSGGTSRYDGKSFRNYISDRNGINEDRTGKTFPNRQPDGVGPIIEDKKGEFWFGTSGNVYIYDGKTFTVFTHNGKPFKNVRSIIEDKKGNIWLSGDDGLWRYDGSTFTNFTQNFVGDIYEDKKGNIWTGSKRVDGWWVLSRYDEKSLSNNKPTVTEIKSEYVDNMIFGILEAHDGSFWFGTLLGAYRYDGNTITDFKGKQGQE